MVVSTKISNAGPFVLYDPQSEVGLRLCHVKVEPRKFEILGNRGLF